MIVNISRPAPYTLKKNIDSVVDCNDLLGVRAHHSISMISSVDKTFAKPFLKTFNAGSCISESSVDVTSLPDTT